VVLERPRCRHRHHRSNGGAVAEEPELRGRVPLGEVLGYSPVQK